MGELTVKSKCMDRKGLSPFNPKGSSGDCPLWSTSLDNWNGKRIRMQQWYRSGIEGYCKSAAHMMGLPDNNSGWGNFGRDLFADGRFDDPVKASKTWTLSRFRSQGPSNRPKLFEDSWLGEHGRDRELTAVHTCVHHMCIDEGESSLYELFQSSPETFPAGFHGIVLPAIAEGFSAERYHPSDIERFTQGIDKALGKLDPSLPQTFRNFAIPLVAGLIYGPDHAIARSSTNSATLRKGGGDEAGDSPLSSIDSETIVLTQLFSDDAGLVGHSSTFGSECAILLGRDSDAGSYLSACDGELGEAIAQRTPRLFPISHTHKSTSKAHGVIVRLEESWYYCDLSTNGTFIQNEHCPSAVHRGIATLTPGDRIYLGLSEPPTGDPVSFHLATTILVSFKVDEADFE